MKIKYGYNIPASLQLFNGNQTKYVRAFLRDASNTLFSTLSLTHVASGLYENHSVQMPNTAFVTVQYIVYDDAGFTTPSTTYSLAIDLFTLDTEAGNSTNTIIGVLSNPEIIGIVPNNDQIN